MKTRCSTITIPFVHDSQSQFVYTKSGDDFLACESLLRFLKWRPLDRTNLIPMRGKLTVSSKPIKGGRQLIFRKNRLYDYAWTNFGYGRLSFIFKALLDEASKIDFFKPFIASDGIVLENRNSICVYVKVE